MSRKYNELLPFGGYRQSNPFSRTLYDIFGGDSAPAPDYTPMAQASKEAAEISAALGREQLAENKRQYENNMAVSKPVVDAQLGLMNQQKTQGDDYYSYAKQYSRPAEMAVFYEAMGLSPDEIAQIESSRNTETSAAKAANAEKQAKISSTPNYINIPTQSIKTVLPDGAIKGSDITGSFSTGNKSNGLFNSLGGFALNNGLFNNKETADANSYYVKNADGTYKSINPTYETVNGSQSVQIQGQSALPSNDAVDTPETNALLAKLSASAGLRQQQEASDTAIADSRKGSTEATNMAIRQGLRYGMSPDKIAAANATIGTQLATNQAAMANAGREKAKALSYAKKLDVSGLFRGLTGVSQSAYGQATNNGNSAVNNQMQPSNAYMNGISQGNSTIMQGKQMQIGGLGSILNNQTSVYNNSSQDGGIWGALGSIGGAAMGASSKPWIFSDKNMKKNIKPADDNAALDGITKTEYSRWKYDPEKVTDAEFKMIDDKEHVGAMAQDLKKNLGSQVSDGKTVDIISAIGVNMAATKALSKKVDKLMKKGSK